MADYSRADLDALFDEAGKQYGIDPHFLRAIAQQESGINPGVRDSYQGAQGLMQILPETARGLGISDPRDPAQAIPAAAKYLAEGLAKTGSLGGAAMYYHGGPDTRIWGPKTDAYRQAVASHYQKFAKGGAPGAIENAAPQADNAPNLGSGALPAMAYAPTQKAPEMPKAKDDGSLFSHLGIDPPKGEDAAPSSDSLFSHLGMDAPAPAKAPVSSGDLQGAAAGAGIVNGIPIVGPSILSGLEATGAAANAVLNNTRYSDERAAIEKRVADANAEHPRAAFGGHLVGAGGAYAIGGIPAMGAKALGYAGAMVPRMLAGMGSNALIGGTDAAVRGQDPVVGAVVGGVGGTAAPVVGGVLGGTANRLTGWARSVWGPGIEGVSRSAANVINRAISAEDPAAVRAALAQAGEHGMLADAGPSLTGLTRAVRDEPGAGQGIIENALTGRSKAAPERIGSQLNESLGPARDPALAAADIAKLRAQEGAAYQGVHANAPPVDVGGVVSAIDQKLSTATGAQKTALQKIKDTLTVAPAKLDEAGNVVTPAKYVDNSETLHNLRMDIDAVLNHGAPGLGVEQGAVSRTQGSLKMARSALDDALKTQVPGMAEADAKSALLANRQNAVERGFTEVLGAKAPHPESFAAQRAAQSPGESIAENIGIRGRIDRMFGTGTQRDPVTLNKLLAGGEDGYAAANLKTAFGEQPVNKLLDTLNRERTFAHTANEVIGQSATSRAQAAGAWLKEATPGSTNFTGATGIGLLTQGAKKLLGDPLIEMIFRTSSEPMRAEMAHVLTAQGQTRDQIVEKLLALHRRQNTTSAVGSAISSGLNLTGNRLLQGASGTMRPNM